LEGALRHCDNTSPGTQHRKR